MPQSSANPTWWQVAVQPRYLAGLALAIAAAGVFALLANWQWSRTLTPIPAPPQEFESVELSELIRPGGTLPAELINRPVQFSATIDFSNAFIVSGRRQLASGVETVPGYWLVSNSFPTEAETALDSAPSAQSSLTVAIYFSTDLERLVLLRDDLAGLTSELSAELDFEGVLAAPEGPRPLQLPALASLSVAQLVNLYSAETLRSYPAVVIFTESSVKGFTDHLLEQGILVPAGIDPIRIRYLEEDFEVNWLTAFYAIEWVIFAIIAFYIWWRLVSDARTRARAN